MVESSHDKMLRGPGNQCLILQKSTQNCFSFLNNSLHVQKLLSVSLMVTIKHKPIIDVQKIMRKESKHNATASHQTTREESRKPEKKPEMNYKTEKKY